MNLHSGLSLRSQGCIASCTGLQFLTEQGCESLPHRDVPNGEVSLKLVRIPSRKRKSFDHGLVQFQKRASSHVGHSSYCNQEMSKATQKEDLDAVVAKHSSNFKQPPSDPPLWTARFRRFSRNWGSHKRQLQMDKMNGTFHHGQSRP